MKRYAILCALIVLSVSPLVAEAGTFVIDRVWYADGPLSSTRINKRVGSSATYEGSVDIGDNNWAIQATLTVGQARYDGSPKEGQGITANQSIVCEDDRCGGAHEFDRCPETTYGGYGVVAIYHNWSPETDREDLAPGSSDCTMASPDSGSCLYQDPDQDNGCCQGTCTPILLDLGGAGFELSGVEPPVAFDIDADGVPDSISWTRLGGDEAFLALDRNGNGVIDSGSELFGAATDQPPSDDPNGFLALAVFDTAVAGGNGDGRITVDDAVFSRLVLWNDADRDGTSSPSELTSLGDHGVVELSIEHVVSERRDRYGNRFRWTGRARTTEMRPITASDVVFVSAPDQSLQR